MRRESRPAVRLGLALGLVASVVVLPAREVGAEDEHDHAVHADAAGAAARTPVKLSDEEKTWKAFVQHVESLGKGDLLPRPEEDDEPLDDLIEDKLEADRRHDHEHEHEDWMPDFAAGDPMLPVLFGLSNELILLDSLFRASDDPFAEEPEDPEAARRVRHARIDRLVEKIREGDDPYLEAYSRLYSARADLEKENYVEAGKKLRSLQDSEFFLAKGQLHRDLAVTYRELGDETLAILELQLYLAELGDVDIAEEQWVEQQLEAFRDEGHPGPLNDTAQQADSISRRLVEAGSIELDPEGKPVRSNSPEGAPTVEKQREVEDILKKTIQLLESDSKGGGSGLATIDKQRRLEDVLEKVIVLMEGGNRRCKVCGKKPCQTPLECNEVILVEGEGPGKGKPRPRPGQQPGDRKQRGPGDPRENDPDQAAEKSKIVEGKSENFHRNDAETDNEAWARFNDREVARSLRELWGKIPVGYRKMVSQYYEDITDLSSDREDSGK